jgi:hypothetical protein
VEAFMSLAESLPRRKRRTHRKRFRKSAFHQHAARRKPGDVHTVQSFCESNSISESLYYKLKRLNKGPREAELGNRIIITEEAERDWRREREAETAARRAAKLELSG